MVEYAVMLERYKGSTRPDVCIFRDEDREKAIREMRKYCVMYGFSVQDQDGRFTIANIALVEKEPIAGAPIISKMSYSELFDELDRRR